MNFQRKLLELLREACALGRIGIDVPEAARLTLRQEEKFRGYYDRLDHLLLVSFTQVSPYEALGHHEQHPSLGKPPYPIAGGVLSMY